MDASGHCLLLWRSFLQAIECAFHRANRGVEQLPVDRLRRLRASSESSFSTSLASVHDFNASASAVEMSLAVTFASNNRFALARDSTCVTLAAPTADFESRRRRRRLCGCLLDEDTDRSRRMQRKHGGDLGLCRRQRDCGHGSLHAGFIQRAGGEQVARFATRDAPRLPAPH